MEQETATLILNTFDINPAVFAADYYNQTIDNQYGTITNNRCNITWKNINMRQVLGEMYDKYETFNMYLYQVVQSSALSGGTPALPSTGLAPIGGQNGLVDIRIKGLQFLNNTYNPVSRNNTTSAFLTSYVLNIGASTAVGTVTPMFNPTILTFSKSVENVDINIEMKTTREQFNPPINNATALGTFIYLFKFYGITNKPPNVITNGSRM